MPNESLRFRPLPSWDAMPSRVPFVTGFFHHRGEIIRSPTPHFFDSEGDIRYVNCLIGCRTQSTYGPTYLPIECPAQTARHSIRHIGVRAVRGQQGSWSSHAIPFSTVLHRHVYGRQTCRYLSSRLAIGRDPIRAAYASTFQTVASPV